MRFVANPNDDVERRRQKILEEQRRENQRIADEEQARVDKTRNKKDK